MASSLPSQTSLNIPLFDPINRKLPRHKWQREDREVVCLLYRLYSNQIKDKTAIFNYLFKDCLEREGFQNGLAPTTIQTQWHDMRSGANGNDLWRNIHIEKTIAQCRAQYEDLNCLVEGAASALGLKLCLCLQPSDVTKMYSYRSGKRTKSIKKARQMLNDTMWEGKNTEGQASSVSAPVAGGPTAAPLSVSSRIQPNGEAAQNLHCNFRSRYEPRKCIPTLLFRFSDEFSAAKGPFLKTSTGFIAGSFANSAEEIPPLPAELLHALAFLHLTPSQRITQTPFISFFSGILPTLNRALRSASNSYVTVVDSQIAEKALKEKLGEGQQTIYSVYDLVSKFGLELRNKYNGPTEYLVYGVVPQQAIVGILKMSDLITSPIYSDGFLSVLQFDLIEHNEYAAYLSSKLEKLAQPMLHRTGQVVGSLLSLGNTKPEYIEILAKKIALWWRFGGYKTAPTSESYADYMAGVWAACGSPHVHTVGLKEEKRGDVPRVFYDWEDQKAHSDIARVCPAVAESSDDERDLIDRQFESDCPGIYANHREESGDWGRPTAHIGEWQGSPWRTVTLHKPLHTCTTPATTASKKPFYPDLTDDSDQDQSFHDAAMNKLAATAWKRKQNGCVLINKAAKANGKLARTKAVGNDLVVIQYVDLLDD